MRRASLAKTGLELFGIVLAYVLLLRYPQLLFAYATSLDNFVLHSDRPFSSAAGRLTTVSVAWHRIPCQTMSFCVMQTSTMTG